MRKINFEIKGISPLKMDKFVIEKESDVKVKKTKLEYKKNAEEKCYRDEKDNLCIPATVLKACIREASRDLVGRSNKTETERNIRAGLFIEPFNLSLGKKNIDCIAEDVVVRRGGKTSDSTRVVTFRPFIKEWSCKGTVICDEGFKFEFLKQVFEKAGLYFGLLGHRPEFGRFEVTHFKEI